MPEISREVTQKAYFIEYVCDTCGEGTFVRNGNTVCMTEPIQYPHKCTNCGAESNFTKQYPQAGHKYFDKENAQEPSQTAQGTAAAGSYPLRIKRLTETAVIPVYAKQVDSGFDLRASETVALLPGRTDIIPTGLAMAIPQGYELQIRPRSGAALRGTLMVKNSPGTIDSGYRGEIGVIMYNHGDSAVIVDRGSRIAQAVLCPVAHAEFIEVSELDETERGDGGYGHTGTD